MLQFPKANGQTSQLYVPRQAAKVMLGAMIADVKTSPKAHATSG
jgi:hypothetical protein